MSLEGVQVGDYQLHQLVDSDGVVETYLAAGQFKEQWAVVKVIRTDLASSDNSMKAAIQRCMNKAIALEKLRHPNILPLSGFGWVRFNNVTVPCITLPYRGEKNLGQWLQERGITSLAPMEAASIIHQAADALENVHQQGIIHRQVSPANFIVLNNADNSRYPHLLLTNFDLSVSPDVINVFQQVRSAPAYIAPEQWHGEHLPASDQYALAVLAYELLTGRSPFQEAGGSFMKQHLTVQPQPPHTFNPELSQDIDFILTHALEKNPQKRFASLAAFDRAFQSAIQEAQRKLNEPGEVQDKPAVPSKLPATPDTSSLLAKQVTETLLAKQIEEVNQKALYKNPLSSIRPSRLTILLIMLAICLTIGSSIVYYAAIYRQNQFYTQATAIALLPTLTAQATAKAQAQATATFTAFQDHFDQITANAPTFSDSMTDPNDKGWDRENTSQGSCDFTNTGYNVRAYEKSVTQSCFNRALALGNFVFQVHLQVNQTDFCTFIFRANAEKKTDYSFVWSVGGAYELVAYSGFTNQSKILIKGETIPFSQKKVYQFAVVAIRSQFDFYINGLFVSSAHDSSAISSFGELGLAATTTSAPAASVLYSDVQVWNL